MSLCDFIEAEDLHFDCNSEKNFQFPIITRIFGGGIFSAEAQSVEYDFPSDAGSFSCRQIVDN